MATTFLSFRSTSWLIDKRSASTALVYNTRSFFGVSDPKVSLVIQSLGSHPGVMGRLTMPPVHMFSPFFFSPIRAFLLPLYCPTFSRFCRLEADFFLAPLSRATRFLKSGVEPAAPQSPFCFFGSAPAIFSGHSTNILPMRISCPLRSGPTVSHNFVDTDLQPELPGSFLCTCLAASLLSRFAWRHFWAIRANPGVSRSWCGIIAPTPAGPLFSSREKCSLRISPLPPFVYFVLIGQGMRPCPVSRSRSLTPNLPPVYPVTCPDSPQFKRKIVARGGRSISSHPPPPHPLPARIPVRQSPECSHVVYPLFFSRFCAGPR